MEFKPEVVAFARAFAHASEDRDAAVLHGHVVDQLHDEHGLAHARAAEKTDLAALQERLDQVNHLDAGLEHFELRGLIFECRCATVNRQAVLRGNRAELIYRLAQHVHHAAQGAAAHGHADRRAFVKSLHPAHHALGGLHRHAAHAPFAQVLLHFGDDIERLRQIEPIARDAHGVINLRQFGFFELHVDDRSNDLHDGSSVIARHLRSCSAGTNYVLLEFQECRDKTRPGSTTTAQRLRR